MHQDTICGLNAVWALFRRRPDDILRLFYTAPARGAAGPLCAALAKRRLPYRELPPDEMQKAAGTTHHGGIAVVANRRFLPFIDVDAPPRVPLLLVLDQVGNPHNLGAIARSAAFFGVAAMLLHEQPGAALPSDAAYRTAEGGLEHLDVFRTKDLARAMRGLAPHYRIAAATLDGEAVPPTSVPRDRPLALILGHEEQGVSEPVLALCRRRIRIQGAGPVQSLNVAQAACTLIYALTLPTSAPVPATSV
jgi:RNA methyltransferase, TrmH family